MEVWIPIVFFTVALLYSNAGFGGGSSYIAVLTILGYAVEEIRPIALVCNVVVVALSTGLFLKFKLLPKKSWPLLVVGVPAAYACALIPLSGSTHLLVLGGVLLAVGALLLVQTLLTTSDFKAQDSAKALPFVLGAGIGGLSGLVGIGGGIMLSPILHLRRWAQPLEIAATAAAFILVNSCAGLFGLWQYDKLQFPEGSLWMVGAVACGGLIGHTVTRRIANPKHIRFATAVLVLVVAIRLLL